ncbi:MAG: 3'-5' exonuclease [Cytophagales bacterium]|nr:3'-5' exonuclease [Bernardetiaceae bacterium]MDW8203842.1 3'-5' exonuclease [Cytophagales bacterium]
MPYLVFDVETTGLEPDYHEIIQIGAVLYDDRWDEISTYLTNVYPEHPERFAIPSAQVHELTLADLEEAPMIHEMLEDFEEWLMEELNLSTRSDLRRIVVCGQSVTTDINFLRFAYKKCQMSWEFSLRPLDLFVLSNFYFRILKANGIHTPKSLSLKSVAAYFGMERQTETHNALEDAILTGRCLMLILKNAEKFRVDEQDLAFWEEEEYE